MRWLDKSIGQPIARGAGEMTLFIPHGIPGFVSRDDGTVSLKSILIPVAPRPRAQPAVDAAARLIRNLKLRPGSVTLLHVTPLHHLEVASRPVRIPERAGRNRYGGPADPSLEHTLYRCV